MDWQIIFNTLIGAGIGTTLTQLILGYMLEKKRFDHEIKTKDKRILADKLITLINDSQWNKPTTEIFNYEYLLSDSLETIGENKASKKLDAFANACKNSNEALTRFLNFTQPDENQKMFLESQHEKDKLHLELVQLAKKMKK